MDWIIQKPDCIRIIDIAGLIFISRENRSNFTEESEKLKEKAIYPEISKRLIPSSSRRLQFP